MWGGGPARDRGGEEQAGAGADRSGGRWGSWGWVFPDGESGERRGVDPGDWQLGEPWSWSRRSLGSHPCCVSGRVRKQRATVETISQQPTPVGACGGSLNKDSHLFRTLFLTHTAASEGWVCVRVCVRSCLGVSALCVWVWPPSLHDHFPSINTALFSPGLCTCPFLSMNTLSLPALSSLPGRSLAHSSRAGEGVFFPRKPALNIPRWLLRPSAPPPILASLSPCPGPVGCNLWFLCPWGPQVWDWFLSTSGSPAQAGTPSEVPVGHTEAWKMLVK